MLLKPGLPLIEPEISQQVSYENKTLLIFLNGN
jgi:hypothetical protein